MFYCLIIICTTYYKYNLKKKKLSIGFLCNRKTHLLFCNLYYGEYILYAEIIMIKKLCFSVSRTESVSRSSRFSQCLPPRLIAFHHSSMTSYSLLLFLLLYYKAIRPTDRISNT